MSFLNELVSFPYGRLAGDKSNPTATVDGASHRKELSDLCDLFNSLKARPSSAALHAILLFHHRGKLDDPDLGRALKAEAEVAIHAVDEVMRFCREVLLVEILRLLYRNPQYRPDTIGGGEDWFTFYRQFWEEIADGSVSRHLVGLKLDQFRCQAASLFPAGGPSPLLSYVASPDGEAGVKYPETAEFLCGVGEVLFGVRFGLVIKTFLVNGDFYKSNNRADLTDAVREIEKIGPGIRAIDAAYSSSANSHPSSEAANIAGEPHPPGVDRADEQMEAALRVGFENMEVMISVLRGILFGRGSGTYDTLTNIGSIGGNDNSSLRQRLERAVDDFELAKALLHQIFDIERPF